MLEKALSQKELSALLGMTTFEIYKKLCCRLKPIMIWNTSGIKAAVAGVMNINTVAAAELYVDYIYVKAV